MPKKTEEVEPFEEVLVEVRGPDGKTQKVRPAAADIMCRKGGFVDVAKEKAEKEAAEKAEKEAAEKEK